MNLNYGGKVSAMLLTMAVPAGILRGFVLATMWRWFVVPLGVAQIGLAQAYGIATLAQFATISLAVKPADVMADDRDATDAERSRYIVRNAINTFLYPLIALLFGYIAHELMGLR